MVRNLWAPGLTLAVAFALGGCGSSRFSGPVASAQARPGAVYNAPVEAVTPVPSGPVSSAPLAPPPGAPGPVASIQPGLPPTPEPAPVVASLPPTPAVT